MRSAQALKQVDKSEIYLAISSYAFPTGSVYGFGMKPHEHGGRQQAQNPQAI